MTPRRRARSAALAAVFTVAGAAWSCLDFGDLSGGSTNSDAGTGTETSIADGAVDDGGVEAGRPEPKIKLAAGVYMTCALEDGVVKCWGDNGQGQLGLGSVDGTPHPTPTVVKGIPFTPTMISTGGSHVCASDGTHTSCWGNDDSLQLGQAASPDAGCASTNCATPIAVDLGGVSALALGSNFTCFVSAAGAAECFGFNGYGQIGPFSIGGTIGTPQTMAGLTADVAEMGAGQLAACARKGDGSVWCWGDNQIGELGQKTTDAGTYDNLPHPTPLEVPGINARQLSVGTLDACVAIGDTVSCWGENGNSTLAAGQLGHDPTTDPLCAYNVMCNPNATPVPALTNVREVSAGEIATCAIRNDDSVLCWGDNISGLLDMARSVGVGDPYNFTPQVMPGLSNVAHIVFGNLHACAVTWDDHVMCWGDNSYGQLGVPLFDGSTFSPTPVTPQGF